MHLNVHIELDRVWNYFEACDDMWVGILTGNGRAFCAGNDLKATAGVDSDGDGGTFAGYKDLAEMAQHGYRRPTSGGGGLTDRFGRVKPIIAAVNGIAHGGGFELALACDIIVASEAADFALPEVRVGLFAAAGGAIKLPRIAGYHAAMEMMLTGRRVKASEAKTLGFVQRLVPEGDDVVSAALALADEVNLGNPDAVQVTVEVARSSFNNATPFDEAMRDQSKRATHARWSEGPNRTEGPKAFSQRRKPNWANPRPLRAKL